MSDIQIRINAHTFERTVYILIIIALGLYIFLRPPTAAPQHTSSVNVSALQQQISQLTAQNKNLTKELNASQQAVKTAQAATQSATQAASSTTNTSSAASTTNPFLSGRISAGWVVTTDSVNSQKLQNVQISITNGLKDAQELTYKVYWAGFYPNTADVSDTVNLGSGKQFMTYVMTNGTGGFPNDPPSNITTLMFEIRNRNGTLVDQLEKVLR